MNEPRFYEEMYNVGDRVRLVEAKWSPVPKSLMRRKGTIVFVDWEHSEHMGRMAYSIVFDGRKLPYNVLHDELEAIKES